MNRSAKSITLSIAGAVVAVLALNACAAQTLRTGAEPSPSTPSTSDPASVQPDAVEGTVIRFRSGRTSVDVTLGAENPSNRDLLALLPLTTSVREFNGREKIAELPRELDTEGSPGSDPVDGDLIYYAPWGILGFYYDASGIDFSDQTIHLGTYVATATELSGLEGSEVTIEVVR